MIKFGFKENKVTPLPGDTMRTHKRLNITLHPDDIKKLDQLAKQRKHTRSSMIARLIQEYSDNKTATD